MATTRKSQVRPSAVIRPADGPAVALLLDLENLLHDDRRVSGDAVRLGLAHLMTQLRPLGSLRYAVGACDFWLARVLCPAAAQLGVRVFPGASGRDRADEVVHLGSDVALAA
jgi:hypothetical protein